MADRTVASRVRRYREVQKEEREIRRVEVQVPSVAIGDIKALGGRLQKAFKRAATAETQIRGILKTINAPRPHPIDARTFVHCLTTDHPDRKWRPHIEAFFDEVSVEAIHDLVLAGVVSFEDLYRAARNWRATNGGSVAWIKEMADLRLAKSAA